MAEILIVDDAAIMRKNIELMLRNAGHKVISKAKNGRSAYQEYKLHQPDIMTMDINMPQITGVEAAEKITAEFPEAKIIMISTVDKKMEIFKALQAGAADYILKPVNSKVLVEKIETLLAE